MITNLSLFIEVANCESVTRAAQQLYISQPALSSAIIRLEKKLNVQLFDRSGKKIKLTPHGKLVYKYAIEICTTYERMINELDIMDADNDSVLRLGTGMRHIVNIVDDYLSENPSQHILLNQYSSYYELKKALINKEIDICVSAPPVEGVGIKTKILCTEPLYAIFNKTHPFSHYESVSLHELSRQHLAVLYKGAPMRVIVDDLFASANIKTNYAVQTENSALIYLLHQPKAMSYVTIYPITRCIELANLYSNVRFCPIESHPKRIISVSWLDSSVHTPEVDMLMNYISDFYSNGKYSKMKSYASQSK